jgi:hypothetical protein
MVTSTMSQMTILTYFNLLWLPFDLAKTSLLFASATSESSSTLLKIRVKFKTAIVLYTKRQMKMIPIGSNAFVPNV